MKDTEALQVVQLHSKYEGLLTGGAKSHLYSVPAYETETTKCLYLCAKLKNSVGEAELAERLYGLVNELDSRGMLHGVLSDLTKIELNAVDFQVIEAMFIFVHVLTEKYAAAQALCAEFSVPEGSSGNYFTP